MTELYLQIQLWCREASLLTLLTSLSTCCICYSIEAGNGCNSQGIFYFNLSRRLLQLSVFFSSLLKEMRPGISCQILVSQISCIFFQLFQAFERKQSLQKLEKSFLEKSWN